MNRLPNSTSAQTNFMAFKVLKSPIEDSDLMKLWLLRAFYLLDLYKVDALDESVYVDYVSFLDLQNELSVPSKKTELTKEIWKKSARIFEAEFKTFLSRYENTCLPESIASNCLIMQNLLNLSNAECEVLVFILAMKYSDRLKNYLGYCVNIVSQENLAKVLSAILFLPSEEIYRALAPQSKLITSGILRIEPLNSQLYDFIVPNTGVFMEQMLEGKIDVQTLLQSFVKPSSKTKLKLKDFSHLQDILSILIPYLSNSVRHQQIGVNILLYGPPGTGKTELAKVIADELDFHLFEVIHANESGAPLKGITRLLNCKSAQQFLPEVKSMIIFDEIEDLFHLDYFGSERVDNYIGKAFFNTMLEGNIVPTIWITNDTAAIDEAYLRRFDAIVEVGLLPKKQLRKLVNSLTSNNISKHGVEKLISSKYVSPAIIERATKVACRASEESGRIEISSSVECLVNQTIVAQGYKGLPKFLNETPEIYDPDFINCKENLSTLVHSIKGKESNLRICLYGPPGTGKTAFGHWMAKQLELPLEIKRASDLISMYLGQTEKNIA